MLPNDSDSCFTEYRQQEEALSGFLLITEVLERLLHGLPKTLPERSWIKGKKLFVERMNHVPVIQQIGLACHQQPLPPRKQGIWSATSVPHPHAKTAKKMTLNNREKGFARILFPACTFRTISMRMRMDPVDRSHRITHNMGEASDLGALDRVAHSRSMNGSTKRIKLITGADLGFAGMVFIATPLVINDTCSLKIPIPVSANVHRTKPNHVLCACRSL